MEHAVRADWMVPREDRLPADAVVRAVVLARHHEALAGGAATYVDPLTGLSVMTAATLRDRGTCCGSGCRHCPYVG